MTSAVVDNQLPRVHGTLIGDARTYVLVNLYGREISDWETRTFLK